MKKALILFIFALGVNLGSVAQINPFVVPAEEYKLEVNEFKLYATQADLEAFKIIAPSGGDGKLPAVIMATSHAKEYAILDFSECANGVYRIISNKEGVEVFYTITLQKSF